MLRMALLVAALAVAAAERPALPARLVDVDGAAVDLRALAGQGRLLVVTMKTASCPVCARQLARLQQRRPSLELCGARFVVLAPGPAERIRAARDATGFAAHWIEDAELALARSLDLVLGPEEIVPAILEVDARGRVTWQQRGRNGASFGDRALWEHLDCEQSDT